MSVLSVQEHLKKYHMEDQIITMSSLLATVKEAADSLGCEEKEIAKTLSFQVLDNPILIVMAGDVKIDNAKYKAFFHEKAKMLPFEVVEEKIGHPVGGVCPFGVNDGVKIYLDNSLKRFEYVYPACGSIHSAIKITIENLENIVNYESWIDVCKEKEIVSK